MEEIGPLGQTPVDGTSDFSGLEKSGSICHLRYKLWNVENVVLFKILEQNTFPVVEFRSKNNSLVYAYDYACFSRSPGMSRCLIGLPNKKGMMIQDRAYICHRTKSTQEAELAVEAAHQALFEWADSLGNGFVFAEIV